MSFSLLYRDGKPVSVPTGDPADALWIKNLQLYVNWGAQRDFLSARGYSIFVKSNKKDVRQLGQGKTPKFEHEKTPLFAADENRTIFTYRVGPVIVEDAFSGNRLDDIGVVTDRLIFCFDDPHQLAACDRPDTRKNAAPTMFGTSTARDSRPIQQSCARPSCRTTNAAVATATRLFERKRRSFAATATAARRRGIGTLRIQRAGPGTTRSTGRMSQPIA